MKLRFMPVIGTAAVSLALISGCQNTPTASEVSNAMVNKVVLPSYTNLVSASEDLESSLNELADDPSSKNLEKARDKWRAARKAWELTETWAYGPAETLDYDPNLDDWPVSTNELSSALSTDFSSKTFSRLDTTSRGFHGIEYVLFGDSDLTAQELEYLKTAGADLEDNADGLLQSWRGEEGFGASVVEADPASAIIDILAGMQGCLEEVADGKLGTPFGEADEGELESVFSGNTGTDVVHNISGVQLAWERSKLQNYVQERNSDLANTLTNQLNDAVKLAKALPARLNNKLNSSSTQRQIAQLTNALREAAETTASIAGAI